MRLLAASALLLTLGLCGCGKKEATPAAMKQEPATSSSDEAPSVPTTTTDARVEEPARTTNDEPAMDAARGAGPFELDLDGDGTIETITVDQESVHLGERKISHGLGTLGSRRIEPSVIDIDTTDGRNELLLFVSDYEAQGWIVLVYDRGKGHTVAPVLRMRRPRIEGDGYLRTESWFQGKKSLHTYSVEEEGIVRVEQTP